MALGLNVGLGVAVGEPVVGGVAATWSASSDSSRNATTIPAAASTSTAATIASGARQLGEEAIRVLTAEPQLRHQSWLGWTGEPQLGQFWSAGVMQAFRASGRIADRQTAGPRFAVRRPFPRRV